MLVWINWFILKSRHKTNHNKKKCSSYRNKVRWLANNNTSKIQTYEIWKNNKKNKKLKKPSMNNKEWIKYLSILRMYSQVHKYLDSDTMSNVNIDLYNLAYSWKEKKKDLWWIRRTYNL